MWVRVAVVCGVIVAATTWGLRRAYPAMPLPWPQLVSAIVTGAAVIWAYGCLHACAPVRIRVDYGGIEFVQGESAFRIPPERLESARVKCRAGQRPLLAITYTSSKGRERSIEREVGGRVDVEALTRLLRELTPGCDPAAGQGSTQPPPA
jgi:hypothetical protein